MTRKMNIHYDVESDFLEVRFGTPRPSYYEDKGDDIFERRDEKTGEIIGYAFFNVQKRTQKTPRDIEIELPSTFSSG